MSQCAKISILVGVFWALACTAPSAGPATQAVSSKKSPTASASAVSRKPRVDWYEFRFGGKRIGYLKSEETPMELEGRPGWKVEKFTQMTMRRDGHEVQLGSATTAWFWADGTPLRFSNRRKEGKDLRLVEGERKSPSQFAIRQTIGGQVSTSVLAIKPSTRLSSSVELLLYPTLRVGDTHTGQVIVEDEGTLQDYEIVAGKPSEEGAVLELRSTVAGIASVEQLGADLRAKRIQIPIMQAEFVRTSEALANGAPEQLDIFRKAMFSVARPIARDARTLRLRLHHSPEQVPPILEGSTQRKLKKSRKWIDLELRRAVAPTQAEKLGSSKSAHPFVASTPYENVADPALVQQARLAVGDAVDRWQATQRLVRFVYEHITNKSLARAFSSASEVLESREGDCTEHSVLFSALAKSQGIPTRLISGLVYVGGANHEFGYHEWAEVLVGGSWISVDPTFGQPLADATHLKFTEGMSTPDGLRQSGVVAASLIGNLRLELLP